MVENFSERNKERTEFFSERRSFIEELAHAYYSPLREINDINDMVNSAVKVNVAVDKNKDYSNCYAELPDLRYIFSYNGEWYLIPDTDKVYNILSEEDFEQINSKELIDYDIDPLYKDYHDKLFTDDFYVRVLQDLELPINLIEKRVWEDRIKDIEPVSKLRCYKVPAYGVEVIENNEKIKKYSSAVKPDGPYSYHCDADIIGNYRIADGIMEFYSPSGTYITRSETVIEEVINKMGYHKLSGEGTLNLNSQIVDNHEKELFRNSLLNDEEYKKKNEVKESITILQDLKNAYIKEKQKLEKLQMQISEKEEMIKSIQNQFENSQYQNVFNKEEEKYDHNTYVSDSSDEHGFLPKTKM